MGKASAVSEHDPKQDDQALELRSTGRSFGAIAKALGFERAHHAHAAFNRALRRKPKGEQESVREAELSRLDDVATHIRADEKLTHQEVARRLRAVDRLKAVLLAD